MIFWPHADEPRVAALHSLLMPFLLRGRCQGCTISQYTSAWALPVHQAFLAFYFIEPHSDPGTRQAQPSLSSKRRRWRNLKVRETNLSQAIQSVVELKLDAQLAWLIG